MTKYEFDYAFQQHAKGCGLVYGRKTKDGREIYSFERIALKDGTLRLLQVGNERQFDRVLPIYRRKIDVQLED